MNAEREAASSAAESQSPVPPEAVTAAIEPPKWHETHYARREIEAITDRWGHDHVLSRDVPWLLDEIAWLNRQLDVLRVRHAEADELVRTGERDRLRQAVTAMLDQADSAAEGSALDAVLELLAGDHG